MKLRDRQCGIHDHGMITVEIRRRKEPVNTEVAQRPSTATRSSVNDQSQQTCEECSWRSYVE